MPPRSFLFAALAFASFACASSRQAQRPVGWTPFNELAQSDGAGASGQPAPLAQPNAAPSGPIELLAPLRVPEPAADDDEGQFVEDDLALEEDSALNAEDTFADDEDDPEADEEDLEDDEPVPRKALARRRVVRE